MADQDLPGRAVGVGDRSGVLWSAGFGTTVRGGDRPVTTRTLFNLMSGSKMYTATAEVPTE
ncbi:MAG: serine hydrolase [Janthinobacterium lividum]